MLTGRPLRAGLVPAMGSAALVLLSAAPAGAHSGVWVGPNELPFAWTLDPWVAVPMALAWWLYGRGFLRLRARTGPGRGVTGRQAGCFAAGMAVLVLCLVWPLDAMGDTLFAAHMAQHMGLLLVAPPLLVLGTPLAPWAAALPRPGQRALARALRGLRRLGPLTRVWPATAIHGLVLWVWHSPAAFTAALEVEWVHGLEHACFLLAGLLFAWALLHPDRREGLAPQSLAPLAGAGAALVTLIHSGALGALLTFAPDPLYPVYAGRGAPWGLSQLEDQQLAGLLMWIPGGFAYLAAALWLLGGWLSGMSAAGGHSRIR